jgi:multimeric flavodoxin WrbA
MKGWRGCMNQLHLIIPNEISPRLLSMTKAATENFSVEITNTSQAMPDLRNKKIIFAMDLNEAGYNIQFIDMLSSLYKNKEDCFSGSTAAFLITSPSDLNVKHTAQTIALLTNQMGCRFMGHPLVEANGDLFNLMTWKKTLDLPLDDILLELCRRNGKRLVNDHLNLTSKPRILALHSSFYKTSNTLALWNMVKQNLTDCDIEELHVENGTVLDCIGCSFKTCLHYGKQTSCFYGGIMVKEIYPAIQRANAIVWICPNYNDALSANLTAVINRLTALYRKTRFYDKAFFSIIVSGNSGSDTVARQLIGALNINKGFRLPAKFSLMANANDPGSIKLIDGIDAMAKNFADNILKEIKS